MIVSSFVLVISAILTISHRSVGFKDQNTYEFGNDCLSFTEDLKEDDKRYVRYKGKDVDSYCDYFRFRGRDDDTSDKYSVCVTPLYFNDSDCAVEIQIKTSLSGVTENKITCDRNQSDKYCGPKEEALYIVFNDRYGRPTSGASFNLWITVKRKSDYNRNKGSMFGGGMWIIIGAGVLGLITVCIIIVCWRVFRQVSCPNSKKRSASRHKEPQIEIELAML